MKIQTIFPCSIQLNHLLRVFHRTPKIANTKRTMMVIICPNVLIHLSGRIALHVSYPAKADV